MKIKELRQKNKISQSQIAEYLQMSQTGYSQYETGRTEPDIKTLIAIAKYFHVSVDYLIDYEQPNKLDMTSLTKTQTNCINMILQLEPKQLDRAEAYLTAQIDANKELKKEIK